MENEDKPILEIIGTDGDAYALLAKARRIAKENNMNWKLIVSKALSDDYFNILTTLNKHFKII